MTTGNPGPDDAPAPPTSTGWSRDDETHDDDLAPPFVPGEAEPAEDDAAGPFPFEGGWGDEEGEAEAREEDVFPVEAFDIEGDETSWGTEPGSTEPGSTVAEEDVARDTPPEAGPAESREMEAAREIAGRLEEMARRLRDQGPAAARAEIDSADRFTSLLAGLLAGYLAGRE